MRRDDGGRQPHWIAAVTRVIALDANTLTETILISYLEKWFTIV